VLVFAVLADLLEAHCAKMQALERNKGTQGELSGMPKFGMSLRKALTIAGAFERKNATVYYNGEDGNHAVYDVTAYDVGVCIVNGKHCETSDGQIGVVRTLPGSEAYFRQHGVDTEHGWNRCP